MKKLDRHKTRKENRKNGLCTYCGKVPTHGINCNECRIKLNNYSRKHNLKIKNLVFNFYGRECNCCKETIMEFLTIDHIKNGGTKRRKEIYKNNLYKWLVKNNFPLDYQTLCANCNYGKMINKGICPHKERLK